LKAVAAFLGQRKPKLIEFEGVAVPQGQQVKCRTVELGICGTDRDIISSGNPWVPFESPFLVLGHECLAQVEQVGEHVDQFEPGDWVVPLVRRADRPGEARPDYLPPGQYKERGIFGAHGFACSHFLDDQQFLLKVPSSILDLAVLTEPVSITEKAVREAACLAMARESLEEYQPRVLVTGQGPIAVAGVLSARSRGWDCVVVGRDEPKTPRAELMASLGADYQKWSDWELGHHDYNPAAEERGFDLILECTGSEQAMFQIAPWLRALGVMVWVGAPWEPTPQPFVLGALMRDAILRNQIFLGTVNSAEQDFRSAFKALSWLKNQGTDINRVITERMNLEESLPFYCERPPQSIKSVVTF
jgi:threonine dehydrogenase-like Zn-dependent dehydrogenase